MYSGVPSSTSQIPTTHDPTELKGSRQFPLVQVHQYVHIADLMGSHSIR
jgi:hypothetical protein